ncbi:MAG: hypothetical protein JXA25_19585 [Anaerolineales bacterium]|nr:hypothetical protein [Anaerolineales bacterium]
MALFKKKSIKTLYSFTAATIFIDPASDYGKAMISQLYPFVTQNLKQTEPAFKSLYELVEKENTPHILGTGMAASPSDFAGAFTAWLKTRGIIIKDFAPLIKKEVFIFSGNAQNPEDGSSFAWGVLFYFDTGK